jgi:mono/diheme cytochrome c family protein
MRIHHIGWLTGWIIIVGLTLGVGTVVSAEEDSCAKPIAPCKACHSPAAVREAIGCMTQPWVVPAEAREVKNPLSNSPKVLSDGKALYDTNCEGCHGPKGGGFGRVARKFGIPAPNLIAPTVQAQMDGELFWKITNGKGAMPAWSTILPDEDIWKLITFVRFLQSQ